MSKPVQLHTIGQTRCRAKVGFPANEGTDMLTASCGLPSGHVGFHVHGLAYTSQEAGKAILAQISWVVLDASPSENDASEASKQRPRASRESKRGLRGS